MSSALRVPPLPHTHTHTSYQDTRFNKRDLLNVQEIAIVVRVFSDVFTSAFT